MKNLMNFSKCQSRSRKSIDGAQINTARLVKPNQAEILAFNDLNQYLTMLLAKKK